MVPALFPSLRYTWTEMLNTTELAYLCFNCTKPELRGSHWPNLGQFEHWNEQWLSKERFHDSTLITSKEVNKEREETGREGRG